MDDVDVVVIGAGVVGLAVASRLARPGREVICLEKNSKFGQETSSRNSEVIHSGIYYPKNSLKARHCVRGNEMLYDYCKKNAVGHKNCGKIVVAPGPAGVAELERLLQVGTGNGVRGLRLLSRSEIKDMEPEVEGIMGLLVPSTGIVDSHNLMRSLMLDAEKGRAVFSFNSEVTSLSRDGEMMNVSTSGGYSFKSRLVVNCAGLQSDRVAALAGIDIDKAGYRLHFSKGQYFRVSRNLKVSRLIYPPPAHNVQSLGIHLVLDLAGGYRFGPDAKYISRIDYAVDESRRDEFARSIRKYLPSINPDELQPDTAGIRPKLQPEGGPFADFSIAREEARGLPGLINLVGIDSPGLTSCLSIAEHVAQMVEGNGA